MPTLAFRMTDVVAIVVYGSEDPTDAEIEQVVHAFRQVDMAKVPSLIVSRGGAPNALQREMLLDAIAGAAHTSAVLSDSIKVRGVVTALSWFSKNIKAFSRAKLEAALEYLGVPLDRRLAITKDVERLELEVSGS